MKWVCLRAAVTKRPRQCSRAWTHLLEGSKNGRTVAFSVVNMYFLAQYAYVFEEEVPPCPPEMSC